MEKQIPLKYLNFLGFASIVSVPVSVHNALSSFVLFHFVFGICCHEYLALSVYNPAHGAH